jgi:hypothetical protein
LDLAREVELDYLQNHPLINLAIAKGRAMIVYAAGFAIVLVSIPNAQDSMWLNRTLLVLGLTLQTLGTVSFDVSGVMISRCILRAMRKADDQLGE